jgi:copper(I)-binding protein
LHPPLFGRLFRFLALTVGVLCAAAFLASCGDDYGDSDDAGAGAPSAQVTESGAWARPTAKGESAAVYLTLTGGEGDDALVGVEADSIAELAELHQTTTDESTDEMTEDDSGHSAEESDDIDESVDEELQNPDGYGSGGYGSDGYGSGGSTTEDDKSTDGDHDMMSMTKVESIEVPAGETVKLEPGRYHVMLTGILEELAVGDSFEIVLNLDSGEQITTDVEVKES